MISVKATNGTVTLSLSAGLERFEAEKPRIYREIGQSLLVNIRQGFEAERSPDGEAWEPLKPATVRQRKGDAHPILQRKGRLKKTITWKVGPDSVIVGTNLVYAAVHQFGATINRAAGATKLHFPAHQPGEKTRDRCALPRQPTSAPSSVWPQPRIRSASRPARTFFSATAESRTDGRPRSSVS